MRNELNRVRLIEMYLSNQLLGEELKQFENRLKSDINLQKEVESQSLLLLGIERIGVKKDIEIASNKYFSKKSRWVIVIILLIAVLSSIFVLFNFNQNGTNNTVDNKEIFTFTKHNNKVTTTDTIELLNQEEVQSPQLTTVTKNKTENFKLPEKEFQYFTINPKRDTIIKGNEGTAIEIKANSFTGNNILVTIKLKEFYKVSDIVFANLTTVTTKGEIIETGGMIYLEAITEKGKKLELRPDVSIQLKFPFKARKPDMQLFSGELNNDKDIIWKLEEQNDIPYYQEEIVDSSAIIEETEVYVIVEKMPLLPGCENLKEQEVNKCTNLKVQSFIKSNIKIPIELINSEVGGKIYATYVVDTDGFVKEVSVLRGIHPLMDQEIIRVINSMPRHTPGTQRGRRVAVRYTIPINVKIDGLKKGFSAEEIKLYNDSITEIREKENREFRENQEKSLEDRLTNDIKSRRNTSTALLGDIESYVLYSSNLGWINCDRFINDPRPKIQYSLNDLGIHAKAKIIFHSTKSILTGNWSNRGMSFGRVPKDEKVTIFAIKYTDGVPYICIQESSTSNPQPKLEFKKATILDIKSYAEKLNSLDN